MSPWEAATNGAAIVDSSDRERVQLTGPEHLDFVQRLSTNDVVGCTQGQGLRTVFCDPRGRIVVLAEFCRSGTDRSELHVGAGEAVILTDWLERYHFSERLEWLDISARDDQIDVIGPDALRLCSQQLGIDGAAAAPFALLPFASCQAMRLGSGLGSGIRLWGPDLAAIRATLVDAGAVVVDAATREILRVERGEVGAAELTSEHNPWEAGLQDAIHMNKGCYTGQEVIARLDTYQKIKQHLVGLRLGAPVRAGDSLESDGREAGVVTSVVRSPALGHIALAYVRTAYCQPSIDLHVQAGGGSPVPATVQALPFASTT